MNRAALDPLLGLAETLSNQAEHRAAARLAAMTADMHEQERLLARRGAIGGASGFLLGQMAMLGALGWALAHGPGSGLAVLGLFMALAAAETLGLVPRAGTALAAAGAAARRLFALADTQPRVTEPTAPAAMPPGNMLRFEAVGFAWSADRPVFTALDLEWREGSGWRCLGPRGRGSLPLRRWC